MPTVDPQDSAGGRPVYRLRLCIEPARAARPWHATLDGQAPDGHPLERREFGSLMDLMRFIEAVTRPGGLR
jgi:hypothetical protein